MSASPEPSSKRSKRQDKASTSAAGAATASGSGSSDSTSMTDVDASCQLLQDVYSNMPFPRELPLLLNLAKKLKPMAPLQAFSCLGLKLVGPFEVLLEGDKEAFENKDVALWHRYGYDPPEAITVLEATHGKDSKKSGPDEAVHCCLIRTAPDELPAFVAEHNGLRDTRWTPTGDTVTATLLQRAAESKAKEAKELANALQTFAKKHIISTDVDKAYKLHMKRAVAKKTFDGLGVHCPYDTAGDIGYRPLSMTEKELKKVLQRLLEAHQQGKKASFETFDNLIHFANIANDEMDFGHALELGRNIFNFDAHFRNDASSLLEPAYSLLCREPFANIVRRHNSHRSRTWSSVRKLHNLPEDK